MWGALALTFAGPAGAALRIALSLSFGLVALAAAVALWLQPRWRWRLLTVYCVLLSAVVLWFIGIEPSNDRDWQPDMALLPHATIEGDQVRVHNIRNVRYRSETDYTPAYYDKTFDLKRLTGVDLVSVYWMGPAIAHTILSFEFDGSDHLAISIETRKKNGDSYSTLRGFFKQYELAYVVGDERDVIGLRTNHRHDPPEDVYVYRLRGDLENGRRLFKEYMKQVNALKAGPKFYNTLTSNCTTDIWTNTLVNDDHLPLSWKILLSGYVPQYLYEAGRLDTRLPFEELMRRAHVNARAQAADGASDFSRRIRVADDTKPQ
ncbi:MAG: DUF4105 domain-containing protein [Chitinophagaceae bacterium]|nr:DUF4105 domain-containing protein [Rubrivivax sp.]